MLHSLSVRRTEREKEKRKAKSTRTPVDHSRKQRRREKQAYCVYLSFQTESTGHFTSVFFVGTIFSDRIATHFNLGLQLPVADSLARPTVKPIAASVSGLSIKALSLMRNKYCLILNQKTHTHTNADLSLPQTASIFIVIVC